MYGITGIFDTLHGRFRLHTVLQRVICKLPCRVAKDLLDEGLGCAVRGPAAEMSA